MRRYILCIFIIAMLIPFASANVVGTHISQGATVFIGEEGLNISDAVGDSNRIGWWDGSNLKTVQIPNSKLFYISQSDFLNRVGSWYKINPITATTEGSPVFYVDNPYLKLELFNNDTKIRIDNNKIIRGTNVTFEITTNMYNVAYGGKRNSTIGEPFNDTFVNIVAIKNGGASYTKLNNDGASLENIFINSYPDYWNGVWNTKNVIDTDEYVIYAESDLNNLKIESPHKIISMGSNAVSISSSKETIVRSNPFSVTITGNPNSEYCIWVAKTSDMTAAAIPPSIQSFQEGIIMGEDTCGNHSISSRSIIIKNDVPSISIGNNSFYALVKTDGSGTRTISFGTALNTTAKKYTIRVEENIATSPKYDETGVNIVNGGMSVVALGGPTYYIGELIELSGINTESYITYLYIYGPNLNSEGERLDGDTAVTNDNTATFTQVDTDGDGTWSWDWQLSAKSLDAGSYIVYAVSQPKSRTHLSGTAYSTVSINLKKPTISATASQKSVAKGDVLHITGFAEGDPSEVAIWIMGKNYPYRYTEYVDSDGSFDFELNREQTLKMSSGQYYVIVQHPMQNNQFDIVLNGEYIYNKMLGNTTTGGTQIFKFSGSKSLQGTDAANALITAIEDVNIDDMYTKLQFSIADPYLKIDNIGMKYVGDQITITGITNLVIDTPLLIDVVPLTFRPTNKSVSYGTSDGAIMNSVVIKGGDTNNKFLATISVSTFTPDEYLVTVSAVGNNIVDTETFTLSGGARPASQTTTTQQITTPAIIYQTVVPTIAITQTPITVVPTKKAPGYGAILALVGLIIVATIIVRRE